MGVQHLWSILAPVKTHCPLEALQGKTLAVDLSVWVCEASGVRAMTGAVTRPHLRNLFFRVSHLTRMGIHLIFVVDGDPPELKFETMMKRNQARFGGSQKCTDGQKKGLGLGKVKKMKRSHFKAVLKECILLLDGLGIPHVQSKGEAEAFCALLNREQLVDGCLTDDGDAFVYGARTVYRNLTLDKKDPHVECYNMADIEDKLLLDQNKLVGLALLLGCDYCPKGVPGVGKELAIKVMTALGTCDVLERFRLWRSETPGRTDQKKEKFCCDACGYTKRVKSEGRIECELCGTPCHLKGSQRGGKSSVELTVMRKALVDPSFPDTKIIKEFLVTKDSCPTRKLEWRRPSLLLIQDLNLRLLEWPDDYTLEKALPLVTYWEMTHMPRDDSKLHTPVLAPHCVVKTRTRHGVSCLEVQWYKPEDVSTADTFLTTVEPEALFTSAFPQLVQDFWDKAAAQKSKKKGGKSKSKQRCSDATSDTDLQKQEEEKGSTASGPCHVDNSLDLDFSKLSLDISISNLHSGSDTGSIEKKTCLDTVPLFEKQVSTHRPNAVQCDCTEETSVVNSTNGETSVPDSTTPNEMSVLDAKEERSVIDYTTEQTSVLKDATKGTTIVNDYTSEGTPIDDATEETLAIDDANEETSVLDCTAEETLVLYDTTAETSVLDDATEKSSVVDDVTKETSVLDDTTEETSEVDNAKGLSAAYVPCDDAVVKSTSTYNCCSTSEVVSEEKSDVNSPGITKLSLVERLRLRVGHSKGKVLDAMHHTKHSLSHTSYCD